MSITYQAAQDAILGIAKAAIDANANSILGYAPDVRYSGVPKSTPPDMSKLWIRLTTTVVKDNQAALANANSKQLYEANGFFIAELYCPRNVAGSKDAHGTPLAEAIRTAFRNGASSGEIWFTDMVIHDLPETAENYPIQVSAMFNYRTITP